MQKGRYPKGSKRFFFLDVRKGFFFHGVMMTELEAVTVVVVVMVMVMVMVVDLMG